MSPSQLCCVVTVVMVTVSLSAVTETDSVQFTDGDYTIMSFRVKKILCLCLIMFFMVRAGGTVSNPSEP